MLEKFEATRADRILAMKTPIYRKAYSDRTAWLMAYMAELAYLRFDKPNADDDITLQLVERALKGMKKGTATRIIGAIRKSFDYDHEDERDQLERSLDQIGWQLVEAISVNATQAYVARSDEFAVLAFRGTEANRMKDVKADVNARQTICPTGGRLHSGFKKQYDDVAFRVEAVLDDEEVRGKPLFITGHSLGGAVATIAARRLSADRRIAACYTFGSPRVGTEEWVSRVKTPIYRIVNSADPVPMLPLGGTAAFFVAKALRTIGSIIPLVGRVVVWLGDWVERTMSGYAHAGNMRFLTDCKDGDLSRVALLYTVGWSRRFRGLLTGIVPWSRVLADHGITLYRRKMMKVAERRNDTGDRRPETERDVAGVGSDVDSANRSAEQPDDERGDHGDDQNQAQAPR